jgi:hypothetical protein
MKNLLNPKWLLIVNTFPIILLFFLFWGEYSIIQSLLTEEHLYYWTLFGFSLAILSSFVLTYSILCILNKKEISIYFSIFSLLSYTSYLLLYGYNSSKIIPFNIPNWMLSDDIFLYVGTFIMPTLVHSLLIIVIRLTKNQLSTTKYQSSAIWMNFIKASVIPISWYVFFQLILPLWQTILPEFLGYFMVVFFTITTILFFFFLIKGFYILINRKSENIFKYNLFWKIPLSILFPILGLSVNQGYIFNDYNYNNSGFFGNFSSDWYFIIAFVNGVLMCLPNIENKLYRLFLFFAKSITFSYIFYFFLVFLPYLPFSIFAIILFGAGFLMLTPIVLTVLHIQELHYDFDYLKNYFSKFVLLVLLISGFAIIPLFLIQTYSNDRIVLHETLEYLYEPNYSKSYQLSKNSIERTLSEVKKHKEKNINSWSNNTPYLSTFYSWLVLDNMTLSDTKINLIENVFFGSTSFLLWNEPEITNQEVKISNIHTSSQYIKNQEAWRTWVDLEMTNTSQNAWFTEYKTTFTLPEGCMISDYYLNIGDRKEMGLLTEKKAALWVYSQIRNENRDPGLLHYTTGNKVSFKVFPFSKDETRKTGFELIHKEPFTFKIDSFSIFLGDSTIQTPITSNLQDAVIYVSKKEKSSLQKTQRTPYLHLIVDISKSNEQFKNEHIEKIEILLKKGVFDTNNIKLSMVNTYTNTVNFDANWKQTLLNQKFEGGFYLERAIKSILYDSYKNLDNKYPIIVVFSSNFQQAVLPKDFADFKMSFPESEFFYRMIDSENFAKHSLLNSSFDSLSSQNLSSIVDKKEVLIYPNATNVLAYLPNDNQASIVIKDLKFEVNEKEIKERDWQTSLLLQGKWIAQNYHPETSKEEWLKLVKYSFLSKIMTPVTSYIVVENDAQKAILLKKQEQVLSSNKSLDLGEDTQRMSEPSIWVLAILLLTFVTWKNNFLRKH